MSLPYFAAGSHRDRTARVFHVDDRILRGLSVEAWTEWQAVSREACFASLLSERKVVQTTELAAAQDVAILPRAWAERVVEHERIPFVSYPYEWCFSMLRDAALLQLEILERCLASNVILKDATPYNVQFIGPRPIFIDTASFVRHVEGQPWNGYRQFCEMQLIPLMLQAYRGIDLQTVLRAELDGLPASQARNWFSKFSLFRPETLIHVWLHGWLQQTLEPTSTTVSPLPEATIPREQIQRHVSRLKRLVARMKWSPPNSTWTEYDQSRPHVQRDRDQKSRFVQAVCERRAWERVWDLGCNRGQYSRIAAEFAGTVIAMDQDHGCIDLLYRDLQQEAATNILPLRINLANASPAQGWRGRERLRLEDRGRPDLILCLGLIHHLVIGSHIPLPDVIDWFAELGGELVLEFPTKSDPLVRQLLARKPDHYADYSLDVLEEELRRRFDIVARETLSTGERFLFHAVPRDLTLVAFPARSANTTP